MGGGGSGVPDETPSQRALAEVAAQSFNRYRDVFAPMEDAYIQDVVGMSSQENYERAAGIGGTAYQAEFDPIVREQQSEMLSRGIDPSSGAFGEGSQALRRAHAAGQGLGVANAQIANTDRFYQGLSNVVAMGQGIPTQAIGGYSDLASSAAEQASSEAETRFGKRQQGQQILGTAAGAGLGSWMQRPGSGWGA